MTRTGKNFDSLVVEEQLRDPSFKAEWQRNAPAREFAATLLPHRTEHKLSQERALAERLGVSQPRIVKLESGDHNPELSRRFYRYAVRRLGSRSWSRASLTDPEAGRRAHGPWAEK